MKYVSTSQSKRLLQNWWRKYFFAHDTFFETYYVERIFKQSRGKMIVIIQRFPYKIVQKYVLWFTFSMYWSFMYYFVRLFWPSLTMFCNPWLKELEAFFLYTNAVHLLQSDRILISLIVWKLIWCIYVQQCFETFWKMSHGNFFHDSILWVSLNTWCIFFDSVKNNIGIFLSNRLVVPW